MAIAHQYMRVKPNTKNLNVFVFIQATVAAGTESDADVPTGLGKSGLDNEDIDNTNQICYIREGETAVTEVTATAGTLGTYASGSIKEVDATAAAGLYQFSVPDAALAQGAGFVDVIIPFATTIGACSVHLHIDLERDIVRSS